MKSKKKPKNRLKKTIRFAALWVIYSLIGLGILLLYLFGRIRIRGAFAHGVRPLVIVSNHPSLWEPVLLNWFTWPRFMWDYRYIPFSTPDASNYLGKWRWLYWFAEGRFEAVPRGDRVGEMRALIQIKKRARRYILILFPEGTRTRPDKIESGSTMSALKPGIGILLTSIDCTVQAMYTEGAAEVLPLGARVPNIFKVTTIYVGKTFRSRPFPKGKARGKRNSAQIEQEVNRVRDAINGAKEYALRFERTRRQLRNSLAKARRQRRWQLLYEMVDMVVHKARVLW